MLTNGGNTEGLFRGGFMQSGAPSAVGDITNGQSGYDLLVKNAGCSGASDTLECLRGVSGEILQAAANASPAISGFTVRKMLTDVNNTLQQ